MSGWGWELILVDLVYHRLFTACGLGLNVTVYVCIDLAVKRQILKQ